MHRQNRTQKHSKVIRLQILLLLLISSASALSQPDTDNNEVLTTAKLFLQQQAEVLAGQVNIEIDMPSTQFPPCEKPEVFLPKNSPLKPGRVSIGIRCGTEIQTVRYMQAFISVIGTYVSVVDGITPGTIIRSTDVEEVTGNLSRLPSSAINSANDAIGKMSKMRLRAGTAVLQQHLTTPSVVKRGEQVTIETGGKGFKISRQGEAVESGGIGDIIHIRISKKETLTATITGPGRTSLK